jgi:hypothetical protein
MQNVLSLIRAFLAEMGGQLAPEGMPEEELYHPPHAAPRMTTGKFFEIPAKPSRHMALQLFQTGRSRTFLIGKLTTENDVRPIHYASVGSAILNRHDGLLSPYTRPLTADLILLDFKGLDEDKEIIERFREGIEIIDTKPKEPGYKGQRLAAIKESARVQREMMEEGLLALHEGREPGVVVVVDGSLSEIEGAAKTPGVVGLVPADAEVLGEGTTVLECPFGARTALDLVGSPPAFYMRLRDALGYNPDFGLVRVELGLNPDGGPPDETWASDVAALLLAERFPVDLSIDGWDKSIFALLHAGRYIDTLIPPPRVVTTYFGRSTS